LDVGNVTAYEMLRLLEDHGLVEAEYRRPDTHRGPGRSSVVFSPTSRGLRLAQAASPSDRALQEWETTKTRILKMLHEYRPQGYEPLFEEIVERLQDQPPRATYLAEMVTAIVLGLNTVRDDLEERGVSGVLRSIGLPHEGGLRALAGLGAGLSLFSQLNERITDALLSQLDKYQQSLSEIGAEGRRRLAEFTQEVLEVVDLDAGAAKPPTNEPVEARGEY
jgi:DNA-binding PadR family transcriptional regulator